MSQSNCLPKSLVSWEIAKHPVLPSAHYESGMPRGRWLVGRKSPERELKEFLELHPRWLQQALRWDFSTTPEDGSAFAQFGWDHFFELLARYEALARRVPTEWRGYRKRRKHTALASVPVGSAGRPRKDSLAEEALELESRGMKPPQIAEVMKKRHPQEASNPDSIRKLIDSRKRSSNSEKI